MSSLPSPLPGPEPRPYPRHLIPEPPRPGGRRRLLAAIGCGAIAAGLLGWRALADKNTTPPPAAVALKTAPVLKRNLEVRVRVAGSTAARNFVNIVAPKLLGPEGNRELTLLQLSASGAALSKEALVAEFDPQTLKDHIDDTAAGLRDKENDVKKKQINLELDMENLRQSLRVAKATLDKAQLDLRTTEIRTGIDRELLGLAVEEAAAAFQEIQQEVQYKTASQTADMRITEISRKMEQDHLGRHASDAGKFAIRTPMDGLLVILSMHRHGGDQVTYAVGDRLTPGTTFARVIDQKTMQIVGVINQAESSAFRVGQEAVVRLDAYPDVTYKGKVHSIGALAAATGRSQYYIRAIPITIQIENPDKLVIPDLSGSAEILLEQEDDALIVPASAVQTENGKSYVQVKSGEGVEKREVILGASSGTQISIREGLKEGESVVIN